MTVTELCFPSDVIRLFNHKTNKPLSVFPLNVRSARNKSDELGIPLDDFRFSFDVIMLSETWYSQESDILRFENYKIFYLNRTFRRGGGIAMYIRKDIQCNLITDYSIMTDDYEALCVKYGNIMFALMYRPPSGDLSAFFNFIETVLQFVGNNDYKIILGGDFNIDMNFVSARQVEFSTLFQSFGLFNVITCSTRVTSFSETLLDMFFTNITRTRLSAGLVCSDISDHLPIYFLADLGNLRKAPSYDTVYYTQVVNVQTLEMFRHCVASKHWNLALSRNSADEAHDYFINQFDAIYNECFKPRKVTISKKSKKPWVTQVILRMITKRNKLYARFLST